MFLLFEEAGKFAAGRVLSEAEASAQVELDSGKRVKVKAAHQLLPFDQPAPAEFLSQAQALSESIELDLAWEFAPEEEFGFADLAREYFSASPSNLELAAMLLRLHEAPHYFRRAGKGRFRKASADTVQQALAAIEKKRQQQAQIEAWAAALVAGQCPEPVREQLYRILFKPDKNGPEYKAVVEASRSSQKAPLDLLQAALEAVCYRFAAIHERFVAIMGDGTRIIASGGAIIGSPVWTQMMADVIGVPVLASGVREASSRGAAMLALEAFGERRGFDRFETPTGAVVTPSAERHEIYRQARARHEHFYRLLVESE